MKPYYDHAGITIYHGDCRDVLPTLAPESVHAVVSDPPYFRVKSEAWDRQWKGVSSFLAWLATVADEWRRLLVPSGSLYCFASPDMGDSVADVIRARFHILNRIRWIKEQGWHQKNERAALRSFLSPWEEIVFAEQCGGDSVGQAEEVYETKCNELRQEVFQIASLAERHGVSRSDIASLIEADYKNIDSAKAQASNWILGKNIPNRIDFARLNTVLPIQGEYEDLIRKYEDLVREYEDIRRPFALTDRDEAGDIWRFETVQAFCGKHPCEKPLPLLSFMLRVSTRAGDVVLDSFIGSGSTLEAARDLGLKAIGIDIEERYCEIAAKRLAQEVLPLEASA